MLTVSVSLLTVSVSPMRSSLILLTSRLVTSMVMISVVVMKRYATLLLPVSTKVYKKTHSLL